MYVGDFRPVELHEYVCVGELLHSHFPVPSPLFAVPDPVPPPFSSPRTLFCFFGRSKQCVQGRRLSQPLPRPRGQGQRPATPKAARPELQAPLLPRFYPRRQELNDRAPMTEGCPLPPIPPQNPPSNPPPSHFPLPGVDFRPVLQLLYGMCDGSSCLVFCPRVDLCQRFAENLSKAAKSVEAAGITEANCFRASADVRQRRDRLLASLRVADSRHRKVFAEIIPHGVAFHSSDLSSEERALIEEGFRKGMDGCTSVVSVGSGDCNKGGGRQCSDRLPPAYPFVPASAMQGPCGC